MKTSVKVALGGALIWIIINQVIFLAGFSKEAFVFLILMNLFFLLATIAAALFLTKRENGYAEVFFLDDFKVSMQGGLIYALLIAGYIYVYHEYIDPGIKDSLVEARVEAIHEMYPDAESYKALQQLDPQWKDTSYDGFLENQEDITRGIISSFSVFIFHLMGLFIFSLFFSFFATIIMRKVILR